MEKQLDCRGLACPQPVLRCKKCLETDRPAQLTVTVDNQAARENVSRYLTREGYSVTVAEENGLFVVTAVAADAAMGTTHPDPTPAPRAQAEAGPKTVVFITADTVGRGDATLGAKLMVNFCATLPEMGDSLWRIILVNSGVKLAAAGSPVLDSLRALSASGVSILVCGTCLDFFGLLQQKVLGDTTNMLDVVTSLALADKVIQI